jgi:hypothetical protein
MIAPPEVCDPNVANPASCFRYPMTLAIVLTALRSVDLDCERIRATRYAVGSVLLSPLAIAPKL